MGTNRGWGLDELLRAHRRKAMLSQEELARRAGVSVRTVSNIERGLQVSPRPATLTQLAEALGLAPVESERMAAAALGEAPTETTPAQVASAAQAWQLAVTAYEHELGQLLATTDPSVTTCDSLLDLGDAATMGLLRHHARPAYLLAARFASVLDERDRLLHAATGYSFLTKAGEAGIGAERLWHQALVDVPSADHEARALLGSARATALLLDGATPEARQAAAFALDQAELSARTSTVTVAAAVGCIAGWGDVDPARRLELAETVVATAPDRIPLTGMEGHELTGLPLLQLGRFTEFRALVERFDGASADDGAAAAIDAQTAQWRGTLRLLEGRPIEAIEEADRTVHLSGNAPNFSAGSQAQVFCAMRLQGKVGDLLDVLRPQIEERPGDAAWVAAATVALAETHGCEAEANELIDRVLGELWPLSEGWTKPVALALLAESAALLDRADLAEAVEDRLLDYEDQFMVVATGTSCEGSTERFLGCTAIARDHRALATKRFDTAHAKETAASAPDLARRTEALRTRLGV